MCKDVHGKLKAVNKTQHNYRETIHHKTLKHKLTITYLSNLTALSTKKLPVTLTQKTLKMTKVPKVIHVCEYTV